MDEIPPNMWEWDFPCGTVIHSNYVGLLDRSNFKEAEPQDLLSPFFCFPLNFHSHSDFVSNEWNFACETTLGKYARSMKRKNNGHFLMLPFLINANDWPSQLLQKPFPPPRPTEEEDSGDDSEDEQQKDPGEQQQNV